MLEIGFDQLDDVTSLLEENGRYEHIQGLKDLAGRDRVVFACAKGDK
jgi:methylase of polypeptide subunit release factors